MSWIKGTILQNTLPRILLTYVKFLSHTCKLQDFNFFPIFSCFNHSYSSHLYSPRPTNLRSSTPTNFTVLLLFPSYGPTNLCSLRTYGAPLQDLLFPFYAATDLRTYWAPLLLFPSYGPSHPTDLPTYGAPLQLFPTYGPTHLGYISPLPFSYSYSRAYGPTHLRYSSHKAYL